MTSNKREVSVLFHDQEYADLVRISDELSLAEGRCVSIAELARDATLVQYVERQEIVKGNEAHITDN